MPTTNLKFNEKNAVLATLDPASVGPATVTTGWVSMGNVHSLCALLQTGVLGASATVDAKLQQAQDSSGTGAKDVTGKAVTQLNATTGNNKQVSIDCRDTDLDVNNGFAYARLSVTVGAAASLVGATVFGYNPIFIPATAINQAAVVQQVG